MSGELRYRSNYRPRRRGLTPLQIAGIMIAAIVVLIVAIVGIAKVAGGHDSGSSTTTAAAPCATTKVIPAEVLPNTQTVRVNVYNSTKTAGLAKSVAGVLGARGFARFRHVVIPAAMPQVVSGMKQGWAFAWRSLMAGELIVIVANRPSIGTQLQNSRDLSDYPWMMATMVLIFVVGVAVDSLVFGTVERAVLRRRGLGPTR